MYKFLVTIFKIAMMSLIVGVGLSLIDVDASDILGLVNLTPMDLWIYLNLAIDWAIPNMIVGAFIVVPVWLVIYLFRPPRG